MQNRFSPVESLILPIGNGKVHPLARGLITWNDPLSGVRESGQE
jgi:hypothetical protein